ncbi:MAG TPA: hypothetical protein VMF57_13400 [Solirubrobacteraceae bacterium]|nr:hypothetical protein [Solirubrobacteraceae bacterium]
MQRSLKGKLVIGLTALALAAFAGGAYAATQGSGLTTRGAFLNDVAKRLHVTPQQLTAALNGAEVDQLQAEVKDGKLTQSQANSLEQRLKQNGGASAAPFGFFGPGFGFGGGPAPGGGPGPQPGFAPRLRAFPGPGGLGLARGLGSAASYLGLTNAQLIQQLTGGKSLAQIATAKGKSVSGLEAAITTATKTMLDKLVANKTITAAQEKQILSRLSARIANEVNQKGFKGPRFRAPALRFNGMPSPPKGPDSQLGPAARLFAPAGPAA